MLDSFPVQLKKSETAITLANKQIFKSDKGSKLKPKKAELFYKMVIKTLYIAKHGRSDI